MALIFFCSYLCPLYSVEFQSVSMTANSSQALLTPAEVIELEQFKKVSGKWASTRLYMHMRCQFPMFSVQELVEVSLFRSGLDHILYFLKKKLNTGGKEIVGLCATLDKITKESEKVKEAFF